MRKIVLCRLNRLVFYSNALSAQYLQKKCALIRRTGKTMDDEKLIEEVRLYLLMEHL